MGAWRGWGLGVKVEWAATRFGGGGYFWGMVPGVAARGPATELGCRVTIGCGKCRRHSYWKQTPYLIN
ncbi:hypothetical protein BH10PSE11_BH10PSE11_27600 [soil metagenome]